MASNQETGTFALRGDRIAVTRRRDLPLVGAAVVSFLGYLGWFIALHLRSVGWAPGQVLDLFPGYWNWFFRNIFASEEVYAVRRSALAARHPTIQALAILLLIGGYVGCIARLRQGRGLTLQRMLQLAALFSIPLLFTPNLLSADVYSYISFGRIAAVHGGNPFVDPPAAFPTDPYFRWVSWTNVPSVYGPAWIYPSMLVTALVEQTVPHIVTYVLAYKILALLLHLINGILIWKILSLMRPEQQKWGTALYLLNPLALTEFAGNAHNDVLMITYILVGVLFHLRGKMLLAVAALTLAVLTKWIALPLVGLYGLMLIWQARSHLLRLRYALSAVGIFVGLCIALYAPYWEATGQWNDPTGRFTLRVLFDAPPQTRVINSLGELAASEYGRAMTALGKWPNPAILDMVPPAMPLGRVIGDNIDRDTWQSQQRVRYVRYLRDQMTQRTELITGQKQAQSVVRNAGLAILGLVSLIAVAMTRNFRTMLAGSAWILFTYATVSAVWVWPWYGTWFVALAAILDWRVAGRTAVLLSLLSLLLYPLYPIMPDPALLERYRALVVFGPPIGFALWQFGLWLRRWRQGKAVLYDERAFA